MENEDNYFSFQVWCSHIILSLSLSHSWSLRVFLEHSRFGSNKEKRAKEKEGKQGSRKEKQDQVASARILVGNIFHV